MEEEEAESASLDLAILATICTYEEKSFEGEDGWGSPVSDSKELASIGYCSWCGEKSHVLDQKTDHQWHPPLLKVSSERQYVPGKHE